MYRYTYLLFMFLAPLLQHCAWAQDNKALIKEHINTPQYAIDTGAAAVVLFEKGLVTIEQTSDGLKQVYRVHRTVKILKQAAVAMGEVKEILLANKKRIEIVRGIKGITYTQKNGLLTETALDPATVKYGRNDRNYDNFSFTMPDVRVGSIIDYEYEIAGQMRTLLPRWEFTSPITKLESEFEIIAPKALKFSTAYEGYFPYPFMNYRNEIEANAAQSKLYLIDLSNEGNTHKLWHAKQLVCLSNEPFAPQIENYTQTLVIQMDGNRWDHPDSLWQVLNKDLWKSEHFGGIITDESSRMSTLTDSLTTGITEPEARAKAIYFYVRDYYENNNNPGIASRRELEQLLYLPSASPAEINLILTAMLKKAGFTVSPVLVSRLGSKQASITQPSFKVFNYTICKATINGNTVMLDASNRFNGYGELPIYCYNGMGWQVNEIGEKIALENIHINDKTSVTINVSNINDTAMILQVEERKGKIESNFLRNVFTSDSLGIAKYLNKTYKNITGDIEILYSEAFNLFNTEKDLLIKYVIRTHVKRQGEKIYIPTNILKLFSKNPFLNTNRMLPIYFPSAFTYQYFLKLEVPTNKIVNNVPVSYQGSMPNNELSFSHKITDDKTTILVSDVISINSPNLHPVNYAYLKAFYQKMIIEQSAEIVLIPKP